MKYDFDIKIACSVWVEEAIMHSNISWWCAKNKADRSSTHLHDWAYWTYSSEKAWSDLFPFWSPKQISRIIENLEKNNLIVSRQFWSYNRTKWYTPISPNGLMEETKRSNLYIYTDNNPNNNQTSRSFSNENSQEENMGIAFVEKIKKEELSTLDTYDANASPVSVEKNKKKKSVSNTSVAKATTVFGEETIEILKFFADSFKTAEKKYFNKTKASERIQEVLGTYSKEQVQTAITNYKASKKWDFTYLKTPETFFWFEDDKKTRFIDRFMDSEVKPTIKLETQEDWMAGW